MQKIQKQEVRQKILLLRKNFTPSTKIYQKIIDSLWQFIKSKPYLHILFYYPLPGEVNLLPLADILWSHSYTIYFPLINTQNKEIQFYACTNINHLVPSPTIKLLKEPQANLPLFSNQNAMVLVPALSVDLYGTRLGFGGGYYDRFLQTHPNSLKVSPIYSCFLSPTILPKDPWDISMDITITENQIFNFYK